MSSRHLRFFALVAAVALVGMTQLSDAGILPTEVSDSSASVSASSGSCVPPTLAVELFSRAAIESIPRPDEPTEELCEDLCDAYRKTCDDIAHNSRVCNNRGGGKFASLVRTACSTYEDKNQRRDCQDEIDFLRKTYRNCINEDRDRARICCDEYSDEICEALCLDTPIDLDDVPRCFTGPGGIDGGSCVFQLLNQPL